MRPKIGIGTRRVSSSDQRDKFRQDLAFMTSTIGTPNRGGAGKRRKKSFRRKKPISIKKKIEVEHKAADIPGDGEKNWAQLSQKESGGK